MQKASETPLVQHSQKWDRAGLTASVLCLVHCLAGPIFIATYPSFGKGFLHTSLHLLLLPLVILVAFLSFVSSYRMHRNKGPIFLGSIGISLLLISFFGEEVFHWIDGLWPTVAGSFILFASHLWNIRACHCFCEHNCSHEAHVSSNELSQSHNK